MKIFLVAVILFLLAILVAPVLECRPHNHGASRLGSMGKQIWLALYNENVNRISLSQKEVWPDAATWGTKTSTDFFRMCIVSNLLENFTFSDFAGPRMPAPVSTNPADFTASNNAWCITLNCNSNTPPETPFLFSCNFCQAKARRGQPPIYGRSLRDIQLLCPRTTPLGSKLGVVITFGGSMKIVSGKAVSMNCQRYFNPLKVDLPFLHP